MDKTTFKKEISKLRRAYIKANRRWQDGEIVMIHQKRCVIIRATGVNEVSNCEVSYIYNEINKDGSLLDIKFYIYGYEWEKVKSTGEFYEFPDDDII